MNFTVFRQGSELAGGRYVLERRLGSGGMATVWLATDVSLRRDVAIKIPTEGLLADEAFAKRFDREAQTAAALSHPNLVAVYDFGREGDRPYLVSEYIDGPSLEKLRQSGTAPPADLVAEALLAALGHIHAAGIVHRDVKPGNVLVESWQRILLTDFGIAQSTEETRLTQANHVVGTRDFLAPELMRGERATPASDLYACGVVLRELLAPGDAPALVELVERLTAEDPADRPASAEASQELLDAGPAEPATSRMPTEPMTPPVPLPEPEPEPEPRAPESVLASEREAATFEEEDEPVRSDSGDRPSRLALGLMAGAAALIVIAAVALGFGGGDDGGGEGTTTGEKQAAKDKPAKDQTVTEETTVTETAESAPAETTVAAEGGGDDPSAGIALNNEGYALLQSGDVEGALPKLEQAVASFPEDSTDINYAYALFNYAQALRMSGDPATAIPLLEKRIAISDFKVDEVEAELARAQAEASAESGGAED